MLDPRRMRDHPINVLNRYAADAYDEGRHAYGDHYSMAATRLSAEEIQTDVVYLVADRKTLQDVQAAYDRHVEDPHHHHCTEVIRALSDLLGMDDS